MLVKTYENCWCVNHPNADHQGCLTCGGTGYVYYGMMEFDDFLAKEVARILRELGVLTKE